MNPFEMVVLIVAIVCVASILRAKYRDQHRAARHGADPEADRMRDEIRTLKERIAVLERIATDKSSALEREIDSLRSRD